MRVITIIIVCCLTTNLVSQNYFNERFGFGEYWSGDSGFNAFEIEDGFIINGGTDGLINSYMFRLGMTKLNLLGEIQWKKTWGDTNSIWYYTANGTIIKHFEAYYTLGSKKTWHEPGYHSETMLIKYDENFDTVWSAYYGKKKNPYDSSYISRSFTGIEYGFAIVGTLVINYGEVHEPYLLIMDTFGIVHYEYNYPDSGYYFHGNSVIQTTDGGYAIGAYKHIIGSYGAAIGDPIVIKTDSFGNKQWELNLGGQYQDGTAILCQSGDGNIIAVSRYDIDSIFYDKYLSRVQITKIDYDGNILWNNLYCDKALWSDPSNIRSDSSGGYIVSGATADNNWPVEPSLMGFILRVNSDGDSLWYRKYSIVNDESSLNYLYDVIPTSDGGFLGAGGCLPVGSDTGTPDAWVIKVDSMGCTSPWDCWVGEDELVWDITDTGIPIRIYPNPANTWFEVEITENERGVIIEVFDVYGRKADEIKIPNGQTFVRVNTSNWQKGMYVVRAISKKGLIGSGKLIVR